MTEHQLLVLLLTNIFQQTFKAIHAYISYSLPGQCKQKRRLKHIYMGTFRNSETENKVLQSISAQSLSMEQINFRGITLLRCPNIFTNKANRLKIIKNEYAKSPIL